MTGIDIGTSSSKGVLVRADGTILATAQRPHRLALPRPGWAEHDALEVWWVDLVALCGEFVRRAGGRLAGVAVSGIGPCLLPVDAADTAHRRATYDAGYDVYRALYPATREQIHAFARAQAGVA